MQDAHHRAAQGAPTHGYEAALDRLWPASGEHLARTA
jgi:hypothetical protein